MISIHYTTPRSDGRISSLRMKKLQAVEVSTARSRILGVVRCGGMKGKTVDVASRDGKW